MKKYTPSDVNVYKLREKIDFLEETVRIQENLLFALIDYLGLNERREDPLKPYSTPCFPKEGKSEDK